MTSSPRTVAVLFARSDSVYKLLDATDVFDIDRDARTWIGGAPVVAHPPCRAWGRLRHFAKPRPDEKDLALFAIDAVRANGGVLEHPEASSLWPTAALPLPGAGRDQWGGWTYPVHQHWFGHRARKATWLYICGIEPRDLPPYPLRIDRPSHVIGLYSGRNRNEERHDLPKAEREHTPPDFARWLLNVARATRPK